MLQIIFSKNRVRLLAYLEQTLTDSIGYVRLFKVRITEHDLHAGHSCVERNLKIRVVLFVRFAGAENVLLRLHLRDVVLAREVVALLVATEGHYRAHLEVFEHVLWEVFGQPVHNALEHHLILHVVFDEKVVDLFLDEHASCVADLKALHAEAAAHDGQYLRLLIADVDHDSRVETAHVQGSRIAEDEVDVLAAELLEADVADGLVQRTQAHECLHDDHGLLERVRLEQVVENLCEELFDL